MDDYNLGRDIQEIKESLKRIESRLVTTQPIAAQSPVMQGTFDGGLTVTNARTEFDNVCADIKVWVKAESPSGEIFDWEESWLKVCVTVDGQCSDIFTDRVGPASITTQACYERGDICIEFEVKVFGQTKTWKECRKAGTAGDAPSKVARG